MRHIFYLITILSTLFQYGCSNSHNSNDNYPLYIGKKAEYTVIYYDEKSNISSGTAVTEINAIEKINEKEYYKEVTKFSGHPDNYPDNDVYYFRKDDIGYWAIIEVESGFGEYYYLKDPINIGDIWMSNSPFGKVTYKFENKETINLNQKEYKDCLKISFDYAKAEKGYLYLAKGIGLIKQINYRFGRPTFEMNIKN